MTGSIPSSWDRRSKRYLLLQESVTNYSVEVGYHRRPIPKVVSRYTKYAWESHGMTEMRETTRAIDSFSKPGMGIRVITEMAD